LRSLPLVVRCRCLSLTGAEASITGLRL
jgi:hypothetical protein